MREDIDKHNKRYFSKKKNRTKNWRCFGATFWWAFSVAYKIKKNVIFRVRLARNFNWLSSYRKAIHAMQDLTSVRTSLLCKTWQIFSESRYCPCIIIQLALIIYSANSDLVQLKFSNCCDLESHGPSVRGLS